VGMNSRITRLVDLTDKVAVVTGAASGIGRETSRLFADAGASLGLLDIDTRQGGEVEATINRTGGKALFIPCDVTRDRDCCAAVRQVMAAFGRIDILFNNAGIIIRRDAVGLIEADWDRALSVTLKSVYLMSHHVIPHMIRGGGGSIINSGSGWSLKGGPKAASYCAAKGGVLNLTRAMAIDHGPQNIRVNCVCPGDVDTPLLRGEAEQMGVAWEDFRRAAADRPLQRVGEPEDVAKAALFFASDLSAWVTGTHLVVDGGGLA